MRNAHAPTEFKPRAKRNRSEIPRISEAALKASCGYLLQPEVVDPPDEHGDRSMDEPLPPGYDGRFPYRVGNSLGAYKDYSGGRCPPDLGFTGS